MTTVEDISVLHFDPTIDDDGRKADQYSCMQANRPRGSHQLTRGSTIASSKKKCKKVRKKRNRKEGRKKERKEKMKNKSKKNCFMF